jgi:putative ABC transport system ATP-binding protein
MIRTQGLAMVWPGQAPLHFADVQLAQGCSLIVRAPSGAGKSTWLSILAGVLSPSEGEAVVAGQAMGQLTPGQRDAWRARSVGLLPQRLWLSPAFDVVGNLALAGFAAGQAVAPERVNHLLALLDLSGVASHRPQELSGGQMLRAALARCLVLKPRVVLADEPTASLDDANATRALQALAQACHADGSTLVVATHDARVQAAWPQTPVLALMGSA